MSEDQDKEKVSAAVRLVEMAQESYRLGVTPDGKPFGIPLGPEGPGHVVRMLRGDSDSLRSELARTYFDQTGKVPAQQALADALRVVEGTALDAPRQSVHLRVAAAHGAVWIDLGDTAETVVKITAEGWEIVGTGAVPVLFNRTGLTGQLPRPEPGGELSELWELLNVSTEDRPIVLGWLAAALATPDIPHPIMALFGEQGSGKSSASRALVGLLDPSPAPLRKPPRDEDGWTTAAAGSYVVGLDNLSDVRPWFSDALCRAVTGDADVRRKLYTDGGLATFAFKRVMLINGIDVGAMRGDLAERLVTVHLHRITEAQRRTEAELSRRWEQAYPRILGTVFDLVSGVLRALPSVELKQSPRMADFARVLAAVDQMHGTDGLGRFAQQAATMAEDSLTADPFISAMTEELHGTFTGTAAELLEQATPATDGWRPPRDWPKNARMVTTSLRRNAPALRRSGWEVEDQGSSNKNGVTMWQVTPPAERGPDNRPSSEGGRESSPPSPPSPPNIKTPGQSGVAVPENGGAEEKAFPAGSPPIPAFPAADNALTWDDGEAGQAGQENGQSQDDYTPGTDPALQAVLDLWPISTENLALLPGWNVQTAGPMVQRAREIMEAKK